MNAPSPDTRTRLRLRSPTAALSAFWVLFTAVTLGQYSFSRYLRGFEVRWQNLVVWGVGWLFWAALTPAVVRSAKRFPFQQDRIPSSLLRHLGLGSLFALLHGCLEIGFQYLFQIAALKAMPTWTSLTGVFTYKFHINLAVYAGVVGAAHAISYQQGLHRSRLQASQLKTQLADAKLQALKAQLQPHFLFNTHQAVASLMLQGRTQAAIAMLTRLSDLLRMTLETKDALMETVKHQLECVDLYLRIQQERFSDRLSFSQDIDPAALTAQLPALLLQPLIENAVVHGLGPSPSPGALSLRVHRRGPRLAIEILDDGVGVPEGGVPPHNEGIGIRNIRDRLARHYPGDHGFRVERAAPEGGTRVTMDIPFGGDAESDKNETRP